MSEWSPSVLYEETAIKALMECTQIKSIPGILIDAKVMEFSSASEYKLGVVMVGEIVMGLHYSVTLCFKMC